MPQPPVLLYLHGVGKGDPKEEWRGALEPALLKLGYKDLSDVEVITPKYPNSLHGVDDELPLPGTTVRKLRGEYARTNRRDFERRRTAMEALLGGDDRGSGIPGGDQLAPIAAGMKHFIQADNYLKDPKVRASVLRRVLDYLPESGRLVIVGHSLGSVIAADLVRRLPVDIEVTGLLTIGSPLAQDAFHPEGLPKLLAAPPANLAWWVNLWGTADPVPIRRGVSNAFPWALDQRVQQRLELNPVTAHEATTYLRDATVARAVGYALFGSLSTAVVRAESGMDVQLDDSEMFVVLGLRYAHLTAAQLEGETKERYVDALRHVQATQADRIQARNANDSRGTPVAIADLAVDLSDPESLALEPEAPQLLTIEDAVVPLLLLAVENLIRPFEIKIDEKHQKAAMEQLTFDIGLGRHFGANVFGALTLARKALKRPGSRVRWAALGLGSVAIVAATGGLALAAAPGVAGAAAVTSALAAFGPGGMIGGLLTAGTFATAGGGGIAIGMASPGTTADAVEAVVAVQLATAILRELQGLPQDDQTWQSLIETEAEVRRELARLEVLSDDDSPTLVELQRKLDAVVCALDCLRARGLDLKLFEFAAE